MLEIVIDLLDVVRKGRRSPHAGLVEAEGLKGTLVKLRKPLLI